MRIVSYNTQGSIGMDGARNTRRIAEAVRILVPDIICFQEIHKLLPWSLMENQPEMFTRLLNREFVFQRNVPFGKGAYGIGISTRGTITHRINHMLASKKEARGALEVRLNNVGGLSKLTVFCTHWGLDAEERAWQGEALAAIVNASPGPKVICGDFNERSNCDGVRRLLELTGLQDAGAGSDIPTYNALEPHARIDYCLFSPELKMKSFEVVKTLASDHLPLCVDLEAV